MGGYQCPGDGCGNEVSRQPVRDDAGRRWVGTTCRDCEQRAIDGLSEHQLARLTLDPYLRPAAVRALFERQSDEINVALAQRGRRYLQPSVADALGVVDDEPVVPLVPFWPRYRSFDGDRQGATVAAGPALWAGLGPDDGDVDVDVPVAEPEPDEALVDLGVLAAAPDDEPSPVLDGAPATTEHQPVGETVAATEVMPPAEGGRPDDDGNATGEVAVTGDAGPRRRRGALLAALVVVAGGGLGWFLAQDDDDEGEVGSGGVETTDDAEVTTAPATAGSVADTTAPPRTTVARAATTTSASRTAAAASAGTDEGSTPSSAEEASPTTRVTTTTTDTEASVAPSTTVAGATADAARWAEIVDGTVYLRGTVPDDATADAVNEVVADAAGDLDVVAEVEVARGSPAADDVPLVVRNADLFAAGSTTPTEAVGGLVELGVELLAQHPDATIEVGGHTDDVGDEPDNLELSRARAQAVYEALVDAGADADRLTVRAYGETAPVADNGTDAGRAANRRIELSVSGLFG